MNVAGMCLPVTTEYGLIDAALPAIERITATYVASLNMPELSMSAVKNENIINTKANIITTEDATNLNGLYCAFGKVVEGMDVVKQIAEAEIKVEENEDGTTSSSTEQSTPVNPPVITSIRVETYGVDYGIPETLEPFDSSAWIMNYYNMNSSSIVTE